jgi:hypothetical protein
MSACILDRVQMPNGLAVGKGIASFNVSHGVFSTDVDQPRDVRLLTQLDAD